MGLVLARLEKVKPKGERTVARCPACAEIGGDHSGTHLVVFENGKFGCVAYQGDADHRRRIHELAGAPDPDFAHQKDVEFRETNHRPARLSNSAVPPLGVERPEVDWAGSVQRLAEQPEILQRLGTWRGWMPWYCRWLVHHGHLGLHEGRMAFPVRQKDGTPTGWHVFAWPGSAGGKAWYVSGQNLPLILGATTLTGVREVHLHESQWDALSVLHVLDWEGTPLPAPHVATRGTSINPCLTDWLAGVERVVLWPQRDASKQDGSRPSESWLERALALLPPTVREVQCTRLPDDVEGKDWNEVLLQLGLDETLAVVQQAQKRSQALPLPASRPAATATVPAQAQNDDAPIPLPADLFPVAPFDPRWLPRSLGPWIEDIAERMQCPPDFPAVAAMVALSSVVGNRLAIQPQEYDSGWIEHPHLWGVIVGRPSLMKSPAMKAAMRPMRRLEKIAFQNHEGAQVLHEATLIRQRMEREARTALAKKAISRGEEYDFTTLVEKDEQALSAHLQRYIVNDATLEALGEVLMENPTGVLLYQDELAGLLSLINREGNQGLRSFLLLAWTGQENFTFDRIMRGRRFVERPTLSLLGGIQPAVLAAHLRDTHREDSDKNDGFVQRFSLLVWPDVSPTWTNIDRPPHRKHEEAAELIFERLAQLTVEMMQEEAPLNADGIPVLRFEPAAQELFREWRHGLEHRLRSRELPTALEAHLGKYRRLVPSLALLIHIAEWHLGPVRLSALEKALHWAAYLETHAARAYGSRPVATAESAQRLLTRLQDSTARLPDIFTARDIRMKGWSGLATPEDADAACAMLAEYGWIHTVQAGSFDGRGRPTVRYQRRVG